MTAANPRFALFDSLRAIAALSVFVFHLPLVARMSPGNPAWPYLLELNVGIAVFFLISGFLLYRPFAQARLAGGSAPATGPFAARRALRIIPAFWVALVFTVLLLGRSGEAATATEVFSPRGIVSYFGFLQIYDSDTLLGGISAAWTLCVEVSFYAMLPLWAWLMRRISVDTAAGFLRTELLGLAGLFVAGVVWTSVAAAGAEPSSAAFLDVTQIEPWLYVLPAYLDHFALGMALAVLSVAVADRATQPTAVRVIDRASWLPWLVAALTFFLMAHLLGWFTESWATQFIARHQLQGLFALALLLPAVFGDPDRGLVRKLLANRALLWIGLVSYGVYLWHVTVMSTLNDLGAFEALSSYWYVVLALGLTLLVAAASFYAVERPSLRLGRRLSHRKRSQDADMRMRDLHEHERPEAEEAQPVKP
jgi:peptidoglycan/LPS O-acetylase OafA/YrhL